MPRSVLLGRSVAPGEPQWLAEDTEAALGYLREQAMLCPGCGQPRDESMTPEAERAYRSRAMRCHACAAREREQQRFSKQAHEEGGLYFTVERDPSGS